MMKAFRPVILILLSISELITGFLKTESGSISPIKSRDDIAIFFSIGRKEGLIDEEKNLYLSEILSFKNAQAYEIMIPAVDIISVDVNESFKNILSIIEKTGFSRLPVYKTKEDNFIGYIYYRDLLKNPGSKIEDILIKPVFIPVTKNVFEIYSKMQKEKIPLLFVVDEYGDIDGMLTFEDIAEEIVGEIQTDDHPSENIITKINEKKYILSGRLDIDYFQRYFKIDISKRHFETLAGFIMSLCGDIPEKGEHIRYKEYEFIIEETGERTVDKVLFLMPKNKK
jgi:putative hemolysin